MLCDRNEVCWLKSGVLKSVNSIIIVGREGPLHDHLSAALPLLPAQGDERIRAFPMDD